MIGVYGVLFLRVIATILAIMAMVGYLREAMTHPSFAKRSYRVQGILLIVLAAALVLGAIWY